METEIAYAKVNLALHVRARRPDGYHEIESLFAFCEDGDRLSGEVREDGRLTLTVEGPFADGLSAGEDNLVLRAARALHRVAGVRAGASLVLDKRLPIASGIGGGSADAGAVLRLLMRLWGLERAGIDLAPIAEGLGADVPACVGSRTVFGMGIGEKLRSVDLDIAGMPVLLVNSLIPCATASVFRSWDGVDRGELKAENWRNGRNDLQSPAIEQIPEIAMVVDVLSTMPGATLSRMSGSGATCFALFQDVELRDAAHASLRATHPNWWTMASLVR